MKKQSPTFSLVISTGSLLLAGLFGNNLLTILFMSIGVIQIANLIEDSKLKHTVTIIFGLLSIIAGVFCIISWLHHGFSQDYSFQNIF